MDPVETMFELMEALEKHIWVGGNRLQFKKCASLTLRLEKDGKKESQFTLGKSKVDRQRQTIYKLILKIKDKP